MANPAKAKGTASENENVDRLRAFGLDARRAPNNSPSLDIVIDGSTWRIESKHRRRWDLFKWIREARKWAEGAPWVILASHGDRRSVEGRSVGSVAILDADEFAEMLAYWERR